MSNLPQETLKRIDSDANDYLALKGVPFTEQINDAYIAGATAEAEQAQTLVDALFWIDAYTQDELIKKYIEVKLASYRGEKEVGNEKG